MRVPQPLRAVTRRQFLAIVGAAVSVGFPGVQSPVRRVFAAGPPAAVLTWVLAPDTLIGWPSRLEPDALRWLGGRAATLPVFGRLSGRASTVSLEALMGAAPDLILDVGTIDSTYESFAARVRAQTGLRYELLEGRFADTPELLVRAGALLGVEARGRELAAGARGWLDAIAASRSVAAQQRVYLARGTDGLETGLRGSINTEILDFVGARNVADGSAGRGISRVSLEQVLAWDPDAILTQEPAFARAAPQHPVWRTVRAVRDGRVWLAPTLPFGWVDGPPGVNRLIGARWLAARLSSVPAGTTLAAEVRAFYAQFYRITLNGAQLAQLLPS